MNTTAAIAEAIARRNAASAAYHEAFDAAMEAAGAEVDLLATREESAEWFAALDTTGELVALRDAWDASVRNLNSVLADADMLDADEPRA